MSGFETKNATLVRSRCILFELNRPDRLPRPNRWLFSRKGCKRPQIPTQAYSLGNQVATGKRIRAPQERLGPACGYNQGCKRLGRSAFLPIGGPVKHC